ncbi:MAG TPA: hypothetical protein VHE81_19905 [Lacipirellulaceae bacterium]|nr:hypothetical protein [Lacipirellulaceae bacterium]
MGIGPDQTIKLLENGKYRAAEKLGFLDRYWETGQSGLPDEDRLDAFRRNNVVKWERAALTSGRRGFVERMRQRGDQTPALTAFIAQNPSMMAGLPDLLVKEVKDRGTKRSVETVGLPAPVAVEAVEIFRAGMLEGLVYTADIGEVPSVQAVSRIAGPFPSSCLEGLSSALCLFTCAQYGRQDVIHMFKAGIPDVTLVDLNAENMERMKRIYQSNWSYETADYRMFLSSAVAAKAQYDLVTADPDIALAYDVAGPHLKELASIARKTLCLMYTAELLESDGYNAGGLEQMSRSVSSRSGCRLKVVEVMRRANTVYWAVIQLA